MKRLDLTGQTFGDLKVLGPEGVDQKGATTWRVYCAHCKRESVLVGYRLKQMKDCGCRHKERRSELSGQFGALTVLRRTGVNKHGDIIYLCRCSICGGEKEFPACTIRTAPKSCGCRLNLDYEAIRAGAHKGGAQMKNNPEVRKKMIQSLSPRREEQNQILDDARKAYVHVQGTNVPAVRRTEPDGNNRSGARGVYIVHRRGKQKYKGRVQIQGDVRYTKEYTTLEEAKEARDALQHEMIISHGLADLIWGTEDDTE